jgi:uncharacterized protein
MRAWMGVRWRQGFSPISSAPEYESYVLEQWDNDAFGPFWQQRGIYSEGWYDTFSDVPQVHLTGWYDPYSQTAVDNFTALSARKSSPIRLVLGPWTHGQRSVTFSGDVDFGPAAPIDGNLAVDYVTLRRDWFDHHLRRLDVPDPLPNPVTYFVMGGGSGRRNADGRLDHGGRWKTAQTWPIEGTRRSTFWLRQSGTLTESTPTQTNASRTFVSDPFNPVPTIGGAVTSGEPVMFSGAYDQREYAGLFASSSPGRALSDRDDVVSFRTEELKEDVELTGNVQVTLFVSCDTPDADIAIKVVDESPPTDDYPDGYALNLAHGILRLRFRNSFERTEPMEPGAIYKVNLKSFPFANRFLAGHKIRIDIAGSNFPHFDVNPNNDWTDVAAEPQHAAITIHCSNDHPSHIILPVTG